MAQSWLLYELTGSPLLVGLNGIFNAVPFVAMSLYAGTVVDRVDRKKLLIWIGILDSICTGVAGTLIVTGHIQVWHIYALSVLTSLLGAFESPARSALLPHTIPREDFVTAVSLNSVQRKGAQIVGPALGGLFVGAFGVGGAFFMQIGPRAVLIWCLFAMRATNPVADVQRERPLQAIISGLRYVKDERLIGLLLIMECIMSVFGSYQSMMVIFAKEIFETGPEGLGLLQSAAGLGSVAGSFGLAAFGDVRRKGRLLIISGALYAIGLMAFSFTPWFGVALVILAFTGAMDIVFGATRTTIIQLRVRDDMLGRVMSLSSVSMRGVGNFGSFQTGMIASLIGIQAATAIGGAICIAAVLAVAAWVPMVRDFADSSRPRSRSSSREPSGELAATGSSNDPTSNQLK
ncbi:MAG: major facilitator superfamily 1 [Chloroflexi bacterium]|nr:major facilitator superfamily 1 [Chloroflexota bacterium]